MRLGFDLDDVVVDLIAKVEEFVSINYGIEWSAECSLHHTIENNCYHYDKEINDEVIAGLLKAFADDEFCTIVEPMEGAREVLQKLKRNGHELYYISARPKQLQPATFNWLRKYDIPFDGLYVVGRNDPKGLYGRRQNLDMFVDDLEENLESMLQYKKRWRKGLLLYTRPWNERSIDGSKFTRVSNWNEILRHIGIQNR